MKKHLLILVLMGAISLMLAVPRNLVVVEIGTGTWCQYCPGAAMGADELTSNNKPVAIIENHNGDNFANTYSNELAPLIEMVSVSPNPFIAFTTFNVQGKADQAITTEIYNLKGQRIQTLAGRTDSSGTSSLQWNGYDQSGQRVKSGIYIYQTQIGKVKHSGKIVVTK